MSPTEIHARPSGATRYFEGPIWDAASIPARLLSSHRLKPTTWGELAVLAGRVRLCFDAPDARAVTIGAGEVASIPPEIEHHLELDGDVRVRLDFYRDAK